MKAGEVVKLSLPERIALSEKHKGEEQVVVIPRRIEAK